MGILSQQPNWTKTGDKKRMQIWKQHSEVKVSVGSTWPLHKSLNLSGSVL